MPNRRTRLLSTVFASCLFSLALAGAPVGAHAAAPPPEAERSDAWGSFGVQTQWMDTQTRPGDDFDRYVNGKWNDATAMPADKSRIGAFITLRDLSEDRLHEILEELAAQKHAPGSDHARIADAYRAFMDTAAIDAAGLAPARPWLDRIYALQDHRGLVELFATPGFASPVNAWVDADAKQSDLYALYIGQGRLGLPDRDYYLVDSARNRTILGKYLDYLTFVFGQLGYQDPKAAGEAVIALETRMAGAMWDRAVRRNRDLTYNKLAPGALDGLGSDGLARAYLDALGIAADREAIVIQMPPTADELASARISPQEAAEKLGGGVPASFKLIGDVPVATWQAWLASRFVSDHASVLPSAIDAAHFDFYGTTLGGQLEQRERWRRAITAVEGQLGELLGKAYAERYFPAESRLAMDDLVDNLRAAMAANLQDLSWMGPETRREAMAKLEAFTPKIGAPETYKAYDGLSVRADNPLANEMASAKWQSDFQFARLGQEVDRSEWFMFPQTVNAYYYPTFNEVVFPAAILQPPFFNVSADPAVNYGAIGAVIGHEMGHGFDDQGAKSDGAGNLRDWWMPADKAAFEALTARLVDQFGQFCPFDDGKTCVNGQLTLGENIGDLGGLSLAYRAYRLSLEGEEAPVIDGFTGDQRFFLAWAQVWRSKVREELARQFLLTDPHSPPQYRVNGIVRNFDEWYRAFDVQPGDALYLPPGERVRIW